MMRGLYLKALSVFTIVVGSLFALSDRTYAADLLPDSIRELLNLLGRRGEGTGQFVSSRVQQGLVIGLAVLILVAVVYAAFAAMRYIRSQGDPGEIETAGKATKAIFYGIVVLFISVVGIVLIFVFFNAPLFDTNLYQVCIAAPNSQGCISCNDAKGLPEGYEEDKYQPVPGSYTFTPISSSTTTEQKRFNCGFCEYNYFQAKRNDVPIRDYDRQGYCRE